MNNDAQEAMDNIWKLLFNLDNLKQDGMLDRLLAENAETVARLQKALEGAIEGELE